MAGKVERLAEDASITSEELERLFDTCIRENMLDITLSYGMPCGYEDAYGTFDVTVKTLFLNLDILSQRPRYEALFYLFHELRHAMQYLHPENFDASIRTALPYVVLYNGECFKLVDGTWRHCTLSGDGDYFMRAYENMPYEADANRYAYEAAGALLPDDAEPLKKLYSAWTPESAFADWEYRALFEKIDDRIISDGLDRL